MNYYTGLDIGDADIEKAEKLLSKDSNKIKFDTESIEIIKYMDSCFIKACPGSGKTTTLVGKLAVLADKLPQDYKGICVLSHTNIAKDEIRKRLGDKASRLLKYPNHIGTIQSFVDTYLAIPAMIKKYGIRPRGIDSQKFAYELRSYLPNKTNHFLAFKKINYSNIHYLFDDLNNFTIKPNLFNKNSQKEQDHYDKLILGTKIIKLSGYITYDDAFALANCYLNEHPDLSNLISNRFPYVFIDEVQDTSENQLEIIHKMFPNSKIQYFGDLNQNLYDHEVDILEKIKESFPNIIEKPINTTYRLSPAISLLAQHVCKERPPKLNTTKYLCGNIGCKKCEKCRNEIILYNDETIKAVLPKFAEIIQYQKTIKPEMGNCYKAIGQVGKKPIKERDERTGLLNIVLPNYYESYVNISKNKSPNYSKIYNLSTAYILAKNNIEKYNDSYVSFREAQDILLKALIKIIEIQNGQRYSKKELKALFNEEHYLDNYLFDCCDSIYRDKIDFKEFDKKTKALLKSIFDFQQLKPETNYFLENKDNNNQNEAIEKIDTIFTCSKTNIKIEISTIAGVKGETHDATLLLETYKGGKDLDKFLPYISNQSYAKKYREHAKLSNLYVAMTRPKHLLCLAMHESSFNDEHANALKNLGWKIPS